MPILRVSCPGCGAGLKSNSPAGFTAGAALSCPKCKTKFAAEAEADAADLDFTSDAPPAGPASRAAAAAKPAVVKPTVVKPTVVKPTVVKPSVVRDEDDDAPKKKRPRDDDDDDDDDRPKKKKKRKKRRDEDEGSNVGYWVMRGAVLLLLLAGLGYAIHLKLENNKEKAKIDEQNKKIDEENERIKKKNQDLDGDLGKPIRKTDAGSFELKFKREAKGQTAAVTKSDNRKTIFVMDAGPSKINDANTSAEQFAYTEEILEQPPAARKPTKLRRVYTTAQKTTDGTKKVCAFEGKTVVIETKDKPVFTADGVPIAKEDALELEPEFNRKSGEDPDPEDEDFLPSKPVGVNETWKVDKAIFAKTFGKNATFDADGVTIIGKLVKVYKKGSAQFGVIEISITLVPTAWKISGTTIPLNKGSKIVMAVTMDRCIDGTLVDFEVKSASNFAIEGKSPTGSLKMVVDGQLLHAKREITDPGKGPGTLSPKADFASAIVGSWRYKSGQIAFGGFLPPTEFTKDGKVVQSKNGAWVPAGTYSVKANELVVKWTVPTPSEKRYELEAIDDANLLSKTPAGHLVRATGAPGK